LRGVKIIEKKYRGSSHREGGKKVYKSRERLRAKGRKSRKRRRKG